jgi:hypothetical protein
MKSDSSTKESGSTKSDPSDSTYHPGSSYSDLEPKYNSPEEEVESDPIDWDRLVSSESSGTCQSNIQSNIPHNKSDLLVDRKMTSSYLYYPDDEPAKQPSSEGEEVNANPNPPPKKGNDSSTTETDFEADLTDGEDSCTESEHYRVISSQFSFSFSSPPSSSSLFVLIPVLIRSERENVFPKR